MEAPPACPVCLRAFADGAELALHVAQCAAPPSTRAPRPSPPMRSCPMCLHVYARGTLPHEIAFHEHECARANDRPRPQAPAAASSKRARADDGQDDPEAPPAASAATLDGRVALFPDDCCLCGAGGRGLLRCDGACARAFHLHCVEELQAPAAGSETANAARRAQQQHWTCAECFRGLHRCHACGFLGSDAKDLVRCSVADCGFYFHRMCLPDEATAAPSEFVCPRHTCSKCGAMETNMARCLSCVKCYAMTHLRCRPGAGQATDAGVGGSNLHVCSLCRLDHPITKPSPHVGNSLRRRCANGDVVLILEYNNALLPASAREAAPNAYNQWGVVTNVENMEPAGSGNQLLSVSLFSDDSSIIVPNRYVLRVASANSFASPAAMMRECVKMHAVAELNLRILENAEQPVAARNAVRASCVAAFGARLEALSISNGLAEAARGEAELENFWSEAAPRRYRDQDDAAGRFVPVYMFLDTRSGGPQTVRKANVGKHNEFQSGSANTSPPNEADVDMEDANGSNNNSSYDASSSTAASTPSSTKTRENASAAELIEASETPSTTASDAQPTADEAHQITASPTIDSSMEVSPEAEESSPSSTAVSVSGVVANPEVTVAVEIAEVTVMPAVEGDVNTEVLEEAMIIPAEDDDEPMAPNDLNQPSTDKTPDAEMEETKKFPEVIESATSASPPHDTAENDNALSNRDLKKEAEEKEVELKEAQDKEVEAKVVEQKAAEEKERIVFEEAQDSSMGDFEDGKKRVSTSPTEDIPAAKRAKVVDSSIMSAKVLDTAFSKLKTSQAMPAFTPLPPPFDKPKSAMPLGSVPIATRPVRTRKQKLLTEFPPALINELENKVGAYFHEESLPSRSRLASDVDSFPCAAHAALFRPAFYRPSVVLNRARGGRRIQGISRVLVSQDKRNLKCFIQSARHSPVACPSAANGQSTQHRVFFEVDLLTISSFAQLMTAVNSKIQVALEEVPRFTQELFQMESRAALRWLDQQQRRRRSERQLRMALWYCCYDGSRREITLDGSAPTASDWLCFCANVCHLTLTLDMPPLVQQPVSSIGMSHGMVSAVSVRGQ